MGSEMESPGQDAPGVLRGLQPLERAVAIAGVISRRRILPLRVRGKSAREVDHLRRLVGREVLAPEGEQLLGRGVRARRAGSRRPPPGACRRPASSATQAQSATAGMALQHALDLVGRDAVAEALDDVVLAAEEPEVAVGVAARVVAGEEPAVVAQPSRSPRAGSSSAGRGPGRPRGCRSCLPRPARTSAQRVGIEQAHVVAGLREAGAAGADRAAACSARGSSCTRSCPPPRRCRGRSAPSTARTPRRRGARPRSCSGAASARRRAPNVVFCRIWR